MRGDTIDNPTNQPEIQQIHSLLIADWRAQPNCYICGHGAAYYQCRICDAGVHPECRELISSYAVDIGNGNCIQATCFDRKTFAVLTPANSMTVRFCKPCWDSYARSACVPAPLKVPRECAERRSGLEQILTDFAEMVST